MPRTSKAEPTVTRKRGLVLIVDRDESCEVSGRPYRRGPPTQHPEIHHGTEHEHEKRQQDHRDKRDVALIVPHRATSPRAMAVERSGSVVLKRNGMAMRASEPSLTWIG